jgi:hypothetical protein
MRPDDQSEWRRRLRAGERVRVSGAPMFWVVLAWLNLGSLCLLALLFARLAVPSSPLLRLWPSDTTDLVVYIVFGVLWLGISGSVWRGLFLSGVHFRGRSFEYDSWWGRHHTIDYSRIASLSWGRRYRTVTRWGLRVCRRVEGGGLAWLSLGSEHGWRTGLAEAVREEIIARAGLRAQEEELPGRGGIDDALWIADEYSRNALP